MTSPRGNWYIEFTVVVYNTRKRKRYRIFGENENNGGGYMRIRYNRFRVISGEKCGLGVEARKPDVYC